MKLVILIFVILALSQFSAGATLGVICEENTDCNTVTDFECPESPECSDFPESKCWNNADCSNREGTICESGKCICTVGSHLEDNKCIKDAAVSSDGVNKVVKKLNDGCETDSDCEQFIRDVNVLRCNVVEKKCVCRESYVIKGDECSGAARISTSFILLTLIFLLIKN